MGLKEGQGVEGWETGGEKTAEKLATATAIKLALEALRNLQEWEVELMMLAQGAVEMVLDALREMEELVEEEASAEMTINGEMLTEVEEGEEE